jgi:hypothetical protein
MDTPLENQENDLHNHGRADHSPDGALTPRKPSHSGIMEHQLQQLSAKLAELEQQAELERLARQQMEEKLREEIHPAASSAFVSSLSDSNLLRRYLSVGSARTLENYYGIQVPKDTSISRFTSITIAVLEKQLSNLRHDLDEMTKIQQDRDRLRDMEELWKKERESMLQKQQEFEALAASKSKPGSPAPGTDPAQLGTEGQDAPAPPPVFENPELNFVSWPDFRLCLLKGPLDSFAIDVLQGEPDVSFERPIYTMWSRGNAQYSKSEDTRKRPTATKTSTAAESRGQKPIAERIRINSKHILRILSKIRGEPLTEAERPLVMTRPYKALDYWNDAIRRKFFELESKFSPEARSADKSDGETAPPQGAATENAQIAEGSTEQDGAAKAEEDHDEWTSSLTAYQHLKCLIQFMDEQLREKIAFLESDRCRTVAFTDIWYLFKPGDEVIDQSLRQAYRVISMSSAGHQVFPPWRVRWDKEAKEKEETPVVLRCVHIDFNGKQIGPMVKRVKISRYDNEKLVTSLEVFPLRFAEEKISVPASKNEPRKTLRDKMIERGRLFMDMTGFTHMRYNGLTLDTRDDVDSNVVIDAQEAFSHFQGQMKKSRSEDAGDDPVPKLNIVINTDMEENFDEEACTAECCRNSAEVIFKDAFAEKKRNQDYMQSLTPQGRGEPPPSIYPRLLQEIKASGSELNDGDYIIMSYRVFGFVLRSRKWGEFRRPCYDFVFVHRLCIVLEHRSEFIC